MQCRFDQNCFSTAGSSFGSGGMVRLVLLTFWGKITPSDGASLHVDDAVDGNLSSALTGAGIFLI